MNRLQEKYVLFAKLGALFAPLKRLVESPQLFNEQESAEIIARYCYEWTILFQDFNAFCEGQPGHRYAVQMNQFHAAVQSLQTGLQNERPLAELLESSTQRAMRALDAIPASSDSGILEAGSPFSAYCRLRAVCEVDVSESVLWIDPYLDASVFYRYLESIRKLVRVTLVTCEPSATSSKRDRDRWHQFIDVSRLYANERGVNQYSLVVQPNLHDRWLVADQKRLYSLGGSVKDAANKDYFTIAAMEYGGLNSKVIDGIVSSGTQWFGPEAPVHA